MLTIEYRIPMPCSVEEYRIAQLYMVAKSSEGHTSKGEGVEVLENEPYSDETGSGQFTHKLIHIGSKIPAWIKALLPSSALEIHEKGWNSYPTARTSYSCPFLGERLSIEVVSKYLPDNGSSENVFDLSEKERADVKVDLIDIADEEIEEAKYEEDEDPTKFKSTKTQRGPLAPGWYKGHEPVMTCYKLCKVSFHAAMVGGRVEQTVHKSALRDVFVKGHRQAFCWLDEWFGMSMEDIRAMERETQERLKAKLDKEGN